MKTTKVMKRQKRGMEILTRIVFVRMFLLKSDAIVLKFFMESIRAGRLFLTTNWSVLFSEFRRTSFAELTWLRYFFGQVAPTFASFIWPSSSVFMDLSLMPVV